jgi:hypothetical protein
MLAIKPGIIFLSSFTTFCGFVTRLTRRVPLVEQELLILPEHLSSPPGFSRVRVTRSLVLYVCFVDHCLSFCTFSFRHCVVCSSSIYGFWLRLWYLQTFLIPSQPICSFSVCAKIYSRGNINQKHRIGDVMVSVLASSAVDRGFEPRSVQTKDYTIGMCCFSAKYTALRRKSK